MKRAYTLINFFGLTLIGAVLIMNSCNIDKSTHQHNEIIKGDTIVVKDTAEVARLTKEVKSAEKRAYGYQQKYYAKCKEIKSLSKIGKPEPLKIAEEPATRQTRNAFPIVAEYNARTDKWPLPSRNPKVIAAQEQNRLEWDSLWGRSIDYRREEDENLFKP